MTEISKLEAQLRAFNERLESIQAEAQVDTSAIDHQIDMVKAQIEEKQKDVGTENKYAYDGDMNLYAGSCTVRVQRKVDLDSVGSFNSIHNFQNAPFHWFFVLFLIIR